MTKQRLVVIDGKSVFYRGYYAMSNLSAKDGTPTGGVFGFATMALEVLRRLKPDYVAVAWDKPKTNIRKRLEIYPAYKAGRKPAPADFKAQIPILHELLQAFGWPLYELDDYEADDIMGSLARQAGEQDIETLLVTSDMDLLQVVNGHTKVFALKKGLSNIELYSPDSFTAKYGLAVEQFLDMKALKGDSSDNIPGVPGIGEKTAVQLLQEHGTLDNIYDNLALIKDSASKKLEAGKQSAYMSKKLAAIWTDAPVKLNLEEVDGRSVDPQQIRKILQDLEFRSLVRQLPDVMQIQPDEQGAHTGQALELDVMAKLKVVDSDAGLSDLAASLAKSNKLVIHSRCRGKHGQGGELLLVSPSSGQVYVLWLEKLDGTKLAQAVGPALADPKIAIIGHDLKSTLQLCYELGLTVEGISHDTMVAAFVLNALERDLSLSNLGADIGYDGPSFDEMDTAELAGLAPKLVALIGALAEAQAEKLAAIPQFKSLTEAIEWPIIPVLARMEYAGIKLDSAYLKRFSRQIDDMISDLSQEIYGYAEQEFNIASPSQLADILFNKLDLPKTGIKKGKNSYSTAASELNKLRSKHPIIDLITDYREVVKLKNTYIDTLPTLVDDSSRIHTSYNLTIAQTGRLSSTDPNLQNIPVRTELGRHVRTAFVADPGKIFVSADYSQFELRLAAVMAEDTELVELFNKGSDIHTTTAAQVYGRSVEDVTKQMRRAAKVINFGILYGMSPHGLAVAANMTYDQASHFIERYKQLRAPLFAYMDRVKEKAKTDGYVETIFGRRRPTPDIKSSNFMVRSGAERAAINMPIQGTEADLMKLAMIETDRQLAEKYPDSQMLLQIHDSIVIECPESDSEAVAKLLRSVMENIYPELAVSLDVDTTIGQSWGEL